MEVWLGQELIFIGACSMAKEVRHKSEDLIEALQCSRPESGEGRRVSEVLWDASLGPGSEAIHSQNPHCSVASLPPPASSLGLAPGLDSVATILSITGSKTVTLFGERTWMPWTRMQFLLTHTTSEQRLPPPYPDPPQPPPRRPLPPRPLSPLSPSFSLTTSDHGSRYSVYSP